MTTQSQALAPTNQTLMAAISNPGALGTIEAYIAAVNRLPVLTQMQETELGKRLRDHEDLDAARQLILSHLRLVVSISVSGLWPGSCRSDPGRQYRAHESGETVRP